MSMEVTRAEPHGDGFGYEAIDVDPDGGLALRAEALGVAEVDTIPVAKRILDVVVASGLLVLGLPLFVVVALVVKLDGGPVFFRQRRLGASGRLFELIKFRSMAVDAEDRLHADAHLYGTYIANGFKLPADQDPRLSRWGRFLRSSSLDELPQLFCVLKGDMSMVGPRPIVERELVEYTNRGAEDAYLSARPGLTGRWQVSGRSRTGYDQRVDFDLAYLREHSVAKDVRIILKTVLVVLRRIGAH